MFNRKPVIQETFYCQACAAELPKNATKCPQCGTKARAHKQGKHWAALALVGLCLSLYSLSGGLYLEQGYEGMYAINMYNYLSLFVAIAAFIIAILRIPRNRPVLKFFSITLSGFMVYWNISWILHVLR